MSDAMESTPGWCRKHQDFMWRYGDGSEACRWELVVEARSEECEFSVDGLLAVLVEEGVLEKRITAHRRYEGPMMGWVPCGSCYRRTEEARP